MTSSSVFWPTLLLFGIVTNFQLLLKQWKLSCGMQFGDTIFHQIRGVAMGMSPAPTISNLYVAIYKQIHILPLLQKYLPFYKRFIDNGFAIWLHDNDPMTNANNWTDFKTIVNGSGLSWTFEKPCKKLVLMDMTIRIEEGKIVTALYAKPLALYQ